MVYLSTELGHSRETKHPRPQCHHAVYGGNGQIPQTPFPEMGRMDVRIRNNADIADWIFLFSEQKQTDRCHEQSIQLCGDVIGGFSTHGTLSRIKGVG